MAESVLATALGWRGDAKPRKLPLFEGKLGQYQKDVLDENLALTPKLANLADLVNTSNVQQLLKMMESLIPGYGKLLATGLGNAGALMRGEVSDSTKRAVSDYSAARGLQRGTSGSEFDRNAEVNLFGKTVEQSEAAGLEQFLGIASRAPRPAQVDFTPMFQTLPMRAQFEMNKYQMNLPVMQFNNWVKSLPSNLERAGAGFLDWAATTGTSIMSAYTGGMMGGGGMGGGEGSDGGAGSGGAGGGGGSSGGGRAGLSYLDSSRPPTDLSGRTWLPRGVEDY